MTGPGHNLGSNRAPILIAGGGIGGLALALALARCGLRSIVLERQARPTAAGAGIQLGPNGVRVLEALGVANALRPCVGEPEAIEVRAGASGRLLARLPLGRWIAARHGAPYWVAHRGDLHDALLAAVAGDPLIEVHTGFEVATVAQTPARVSVADVDGHRRAGPVLVGADGLWSAVRAALTPGSAPRPAGATAARTVIPAGRAGPLAAADVGVWLTPAAHVVHYPVRRGSEVALVVIAREPQAGERAGRGWDTQADAAALGRRLAPFHHSLTEILLPGAGRSWPWREWTLYTLPPLPAWVQGRVVLLGDAAHPMLPYLAQGGAMALEDAVVLGDCLASAAGPAAALARFEALRAARARRIQAASLRQGRIYRLMPPLSWARDAALALTPGPLLMAGYDWLYGWHPPSSAAFSDAKRRGG
ncbi:MAG TPA: FAD-dependent monooxygenase [Hyphomicrobiaceae bacterium]|jgi:salicylate hydroxylase